MGEWKIKFKKQYTGYDVTVYKNNGDRASGQTKLASIAIYDFVELMDYTSAHIYAALMLLVSFGVLFSVYFITHRLNKRA